MVEGGLPSSWAYREEERTSTAAPSTGRDAWNPDAPVGSVATVHTRPTLRYKSGHDATDIAATLKSIGFEVNLLLDATRHRWRDKAHSLQSPTAPRRCRPVHCRHGAQIEGMNYLIPIGAMLKSCDYEVDAVSAEQVLAGMTAAEAPSISSS